MQDVMKRGTARHDPYAALRYPEFVALAGIAVLLECGMLIQSVGLSYELYRLTRDPLVLGFIGIAQAVPFIALALFGGHAADRFEKRGIIRAALAIIVAASAILTLLSMPAAHRVLPQAVWLLGAYGVVALLGVAGGFLSPATGSLCAQLVPREVQGNSATWWSGALMAGSIIGPVAAGFLYAWGGLQGSLAVVLALFAACLALTLALNPRPALPTAEDEDIWTSLADGIAYLRRTHLVLHAMTLDMVAVLFGGVTAILPVFAADILRVGPTGLGWLRASSSVGALLMVAVCTHVSVLGRPWRNLLITVAGFGLATLLFALSPWFWLSLVALAAAGAFDAVSMVIRGAIMQRVPPDRLRGRVMAVNGVFVSMSSDLGAFESGVAARFMGAVPSVLLGAAVTLGIVAGLAARTRALFDAEI